MLTANSVIDALGGTGAVAEKLGLSLPTVSCWRWRGIPPRRWADFVRLADGAGCKEITFAALAAMPTPATDEVVET